MHLRLNKYYMICHWKLVRHAVQDGEYLDQTCTSDLFLQACTVMSSLLSVSSGISMSCSSFSQEDDYRTVLLTYLTSSANWRNCRMYI